MTELPLKDADRDKLVQDHLGYVKALARRVEKELSSPGLDHEELVAYGSRGLVEAAQRFDPARGVAFTTFAHYRIRGAIFDGLRETGWMARSQYARFAAGANEYLQNRASRGEESTGLEGAVARVAENLDDIATIFVTAMGPGDRELTDRDTPDAASALESKELTGAVRAAVAQLPDKERHLVEQFYFEGSSLLEAGRTLGLSKSWSSRLHTRAIRLLARKLGAHRPG